MNLTREQIIELTNDTLSWGRSVAEMWTGTQYESQIEAQSERVEDSLKKNDIDKVRELVFDLAQFLEQAESEYV